jgi:SAM-dependent methyltransferase
VLSEYSDAWRAIDYGVYGLGAPQRNYTPWEWHGQRMFASDVGATRFRQLFLIRFIERLRPRRVLEVGCGNGWLCHHLAGLGYEVGGIDPRAPADPLLRTVTLEAFDEHTPFDAVVANLFLHHTADLDHAVDKLADVLAPGGALILVEFAWDRFDDRTAHWCLDRLSSQPVEDNWLHDRLGVIKERLDAEEPLRAGEVFRAWAAEEGFHSSVDMRTALRTRFSEDMFEWGPYLYPDLADVTREQERSAIDRGEIQPTGFRVVASHP